MKKAINRDTQLCISISARPSNFGTRFHNYLYDHLDLDYIYKAFAIKDVAGAIAGIRALGIRGSAVSMPFKEACIEWLDELDVSAKSIMSVNTIVNTQGYLKAYNTDYIAVAHLLQNPAMNHDIPFVLKGSGGMAKAVLGALADSGFKHGIILARNQERGQALATHYHYRYVTDEQDLQPADLGMLINVTPVGMAGGLEVNDLAFPAELIAQAQVIFDVVALPVETPMIKLARSLGKTVISGADVGVIQAVEQFVLYTGIRPSADLIQQAADFARQV
ncbi:shikimate 5-dehydrogenase [Utexia brackfieldae]|uniref:shikimate 5-dehydrogenase n=1 Tax=Utexia brackfieldae TaxID=3074108 RepID=UPI00370D851B